MNYNKTKPGKKSPYWQGGEFISGRKWTDTRKKALDRSLEFGVDLKYVEYLFKKQKKICKLSGDTLTTATMSLDRIDSKIGYIKGNLQWVHKEVNVMKLEYSQEYFLNLCYLIANKKDDLPNLKIPDVVNFAKFKGVGRLSKSKFGKYIIHARNRNIKFDLTIEEAWEKYVEQNGRCILSGIPIYFNFNGEILKQKGKNECTASLDRINSKLGYNKNNIHWTHKHINEMKWDFDLDYFVILCNKISNYNNTIPNFSMLEMTQDWIDSFKTVDSSEVYAKVAKSNRHRSAVAGRASVYKGVSKDTNGWRAFANLGNGKTYFQSFKSQIDAAQHHDYYMKKEFGNNCYLNFPDVDYSVFTPKARRGLEETVMGLKKIIYDLGHFPTESNLQKMGLKKLARAISTYGGYRHFRRMYESGEL